jgi:RimJ/RimL family protein N-acetyltransferase
MLRTMEPEDDMGDWGSWLSDPETARTLNARSVTLTQQQFTDYVRSFDRINRHLLGIFEREGGKLIGVRSYQIDWKRRDVLINLLIGSVEARNKGVQQETAVASFAYFFGELGLESSYCTVVSGNAPMLHNLEKMGYRLEGRSRKAAAGGAGEVEILHLRLTREEWLRGRGAA